MHVSPPQRLQEPAGEPDVPTAPISALPTPALALRAAEQDPASPRHRGKGASKGAGRGGKGEKKRKKSDEMTPTGSVAAGRSVTGGASDSGSRAPSPKSKVSKKMSDAQQKLDQARRNLTDIDLTKALAGESMRLALYQSRRTIKVLEANGMGETSECLQLTQHTRLCETAELLADYANYDNLAKRESDMRELLVHITEIPPECCAQICLSAAREACAADNIQEWIEIIRPKCPHDGPRCFLLM